MHRGMALHGCGLSQTRSTKRHSRWLYWHRLYDSQPFSSWGAQAASGGQCACFHSSPIYESHWAVTPSSRSSFKLLHRPFPFIADRKANGRVGDSRAAMVHSDGTARPLSDDHKPNRLDEKLRIEAAGGHVIFAGCWRVQGDLAVSRAFGDCHLKRFGVSAEPEISLIEIGPLDAFLVLASDGLWDVVAEAQCAKTVLRAQDTVSAAAALCDLASDRGSMDNITALVVDLRER
mmetsp:Transcript_10009/g.27503  ORF Transcript_10009/g.27503 Transcript_10009/m.27503 type:complete len:233 (-) Transcript_10009:574-1272(-)